LICYVDTHVAIWLAEANLAKFSQKAISLMQNGDVRISPMAVVELQYLYEIQRIVVSPPETGDPFVVSHDKANGLSPLISSDATIRKNYIKTVW
jgi:PIN domain nuclease of toxin-antitoxin system